MEVCWGSHIPILCTRYLELQHNNNLMPVSEWKPAESDTGFKFVLTLSRAQSSRTKDKAMLLLEEKTERLHNEADTHTRTYRGTHKQKHTEARIHTRTYTCMHTHAYTYIHMHTNTYIHTHTYTQQRRVLVLCNPEARNMRIHTHAHTHILTHTYTQERRVLVLCNPEARNMRIHTHTLTHTYTHRSGGCWCCVT